MRLPRLFLSPVFRSLAATAAGTLLLLPAALAQASDEKPGWTTPPVAPGMPASLLEVLLNLFVVIAAIALLTWGYRRLQGGVAPASGAMKVVAVLPLGQKERVMLLAVGDQHIVVGASPAGINTLHVMDESFQPAEAVQGIDAGSFAERLRTVMSGRGGQ